MLHRCRVRCTDRLGARQGRVRTADPTWLELTVGRKFARNMSHAITEDDDSAVDSRCLRLIRDDVRGRTWFCWKERSERAEYHRQAVRAGFCNTCGDNFPRDLDFIAIYYREVEPQRAWHARMAKMYELAAACPWLPFDIDAAEPK